MKFAWMLMSASILLAGCSDDYECPASNMYAGTVLVSGQISAIQLCSGGYCSDGKTIASVKILEVLADCQELSAKQKLKAGDAVSINMQGYGQFKAGDTVTLGCSVLSICSDGCKKGPNELPYGPCWSYEFGCHTHCFVSSLTKAQ